ncbi:PREDICTED: uncharacterized protein LOC107172123 isoform X2 [Diuraphis noxia]|uniref:uncharacterized protein LOC107172123 isoform X2 n=1 Tax=Diuraphis noxia TaxID=143948 RepID=UPI0007637112|nr:PREDICTED: uncharacterized protein LOC107172123 isoform X2 [Diuraphis noxia]
MVKTCSVKGCNSKAGQGIKFHGLPKGDISKEWIKFLEKTTSVYQTKQLKKNAVPSILNPTARR